MAKIETNMRRYYEKEAIGVIENLLELIELQMEASPSAVQGLEFRLAQWQKIYAKIREDKNITKDEMRLLNNSTRVTKDLESYIEDVEEFIKTGKHKFER